VSRRQRIGLLAIAAAIAAVAIVVAASGGDDDKGSKKTGTTTQAKQKPAAPAVTRIEVRNDKPVGGIHKITVKKGDTVRLVVTSDADHEIHLHGYNILKDTSPGKPAEFRFKADIEGVFEAEIEDKKEQIAKLTVNPS
jgi:plastocyanin